MRIKMNIEEDEYLDIAEIRTKFIKDALPLVQHYIDAALGKSDLKSKSTAVHILAHHEHRFWRIVNTHSDPS